MTGVAVERLHAYLARRWALVPLHDVTTGRCSCGVDPCGSAGKHPRSGAEWQKPDSLVITEEQLAAALARWPGANWGLATGLVSSVWAMDWDPERARPEQAAEVAALLVALDAAGTWTQRTGSGVGRHWVFLLPDDFVPSNSEGRLPKGFDVRGGSASSGGMSGGQIVLSPSVSGKGAYVVLHDGPALPAPGGVLDLVRPIAHRPPAGPPPVPVGQARAWAYIQPILREMATAPEGDRDNTAWRTAARLQALAHGGAFTADSIWPHWYAAAMQHPFRHNDLVNKWHRADRTAGTEYIPDHYSNIGGTPIAPFAVPDAGASSAGSASGDVPPLGQPGGVPRTGGQAGGTAADSAAEGRDSGQTGPPIDPVDALLAEMLDVEALRNIVPPQPLVNGVLDLDTTAWLIGESGSYKSFVALDLAAHVGLGRPWRGHDVAQGDVVYIVAEGARGMRLRVDAWEREHGPMKCVRFLPRPVQAANGIAWDVLVEACRRLRPLLVVIDTQARVTLGLEENSNTDMGRYVAAVDAIRTATAACVLTVHHVGRDGKNARGASALDGAQDAELKIEKVGMFSIKLIMDKQKDQAQDAPMSMRLKRSDGGIDPITGRDLSSLVVDHVEAPPLGEPGSMQDTGHRRALALFQVIYGLLPSGGEGLQRTEIRALFYAIPEIAGLSGPEARRKAWVRAWALLLQRGRVMRYGTSQRFAVFPPQDGAADGMLTANDGSADDMPPDGWSIVTVASDKGSSAEH